MDREAPPGERAVQGEGGDDGAARVDPRPAVARARGHVPIGGVVSARVGNAAVSHTPNCGPFHGPFGRMGLREDPGVDPVYYLVAWQTPLASRNSAAR